MKYPKVALLAPITHNMPPVAYGPWELVVYNLQEELVKLGVDVTVFTTADANISANKRSFLDHPTGEDDKDYTTAALTIHAIKVLKEAKNYDIIHTHLNIHPVLYSELIDTPVVATLHGAAIEKKNALYYQFLKNKNFISISNAERNFMPDLNYIDTVYNGVDFNKYTFTERVGDYLLFNGRICHEKGIENAIELSKKTGIPLKIAGYITDQQFFDTQVKPHIDGTNIEYLGNLPQDQLSQAIANSLATVGLINWDEPFGLFIADSLASGVPVIGNKRGSIPELINDPNLGILVNSLDEAANRIEEIRTINKSECRELARQRFSREIMAKRYLENYIKLRLKSTSSAQ